MSKRMSEEKSRIEPVKTQVPTSISDVPDAKVPNVPPARNWDLDREELNRQIQAQQKLKKGAGMFDGLKRKAGQKVGEWLMVILLAAARWLRDMLLDVFLSFGVYKKNEDGTPRQRRDESGKLVFTKSGDHVALGTATTDGSGVTGTATTGRSPQNQGVTSVFGRDGAVVAAASDYDADEIDYDNSTSGLTATDVQAAVDELAARPQGGGWDGISVLPSDFVKTTDTSFSNLLTFSATASKTYLIELMYATDSPNTGGSKFQVTVPAGGSADLTISTYRQDSSFSGTTNQVLVDVAASSSQTLNNVNNTRQFVTVTGIVTIAGTAGTVEFQVGQNSATTTTTFKAGASLKWKDIT